MFRFKNHSDNLPFLHDKLFTLEWDLSGCKWLLIRYKNGQKKPWYKKTERSYRFRRWFIRKPKDTFSNLANYNYPKVVIYVFPYLISWPKRVVIPMRVNHLVTYDFPLQAQTPIPAFSGLEAQTVSPVIRLSTPFIEYKPIYPEYKLTIPVSLTPAPPEIPVCDWPLSDWHDKGLLNDEMIDYNRLQKLNNPHEHA